MSFLAKFVIWTVCEKFQNEVSFANEVFSIKHNFYVITRSNLDLFARKSHKVKFGSIKLNRIFSYQL
ncbi:hypothetical protein DMC01_13450 [Campylobacter troglodytis]|nr:hypothetical protein DMC01_13450 [Campylobacter troglodytis]